LYLNLGVILFSGRHSFIQFSVFSLTNHIPLPVIKACYPTLLSIISSLQPKMLIFRQIGGLTFLTALLCSFISLDMQSG